MKTIDMVREFHDALGLADQISDTVRIPPADVNLTRVQMLIEEVAELAHALGNQDMVKVLDGLCDIQYFLDGTFLACGMARLKDAAMDAVHRTNMAKLHDGVCVRDVSGRVVKPEGWEGPEQELDCLLRGENMTKAIPSNPTFQSRVRAWVVACFGLAYANDRVERNHRFVEEAMELAQACGCSVEDCHQLIDYVYGRPIGEKEQEVGGVIITLAALCHAWDMSMHEQGEIELTRIWKKIEEARAKQLTKPKIGPLAE